MSTVDFDVDNHSEYEAFFLFIAHKSQALSAHMVLVNVYLLKVVLSHKYVDPRNVEISHFRMANLVLVWATRNSFKGR